jgi:F-type H+-transporting ATPase subunit b
MEEVIANLGIDLRMMVFSTINFLLVLVLLNKFLFKKVSSYLEDRQTVISESLKNAEEADKKLQKAEKVKEQKIRDASEDANKIVSDSKQEAVSIIQEAQDKAQRESQEMIEQTKKSLETEREKMIKTLKKETADLAILATEKILEKELDAETDKKIIESYLNQLDK